MDTKKQERPSPKSYPSRRRRIKIALIVLNWNNACDTLECLASLEKLNYSDFEVIVVDNGSTDDSLSQIQACYPHHIFVKNEENLGYAEGNNRGLREGMRRGADLLMLLNNDTVVSPSLLTHLVESAHSHPHVGAFGPKIYFYDDPATIWYAGGSVDPKTARCYHIGCGAPSGHTEKKTTDYICGCALAVRKEVIEAVGLLNKDYFLLWEEIDWCKRMKKAGYECLFVPEAKVWHKVSASFIEGNRGPMWQYFYFRNRLLYHKYHFSFKERWRKIYLAELADLVKTTLHPHTPNSLRKRYIAALFGVLDYFLGRFGKGRLTKFIQNDS